MKTLPCDDLWTESDEVFEYADRRLDMEETRFIFFDLAAADGAGFAGNPTGFLGIALVCVCMGAASMVLLSGGNEGRGKLPKFDLMPGLVLVLTLTLSFRGGNGEYGRDGRLREAVRGLSSSNPGGGAGSAFEKRERPDLGVSRVARFITSITTYYRLN